MFERSFTWVSSSENSPQFYPEGSFPDGNIGNLTSDQSDISVGDSVNIDGNNYEYIGYYNEPYDPGLEPNPDPPVNDAFVFKNANGEYLMLSDPIPLSSPPLTKDNIDDRIDTDTDLIVCFAKGTLIATPDGPRAVETLQAGDVVCTADGREVPVIWMGRQTVQKFFTPAERFCPVRIAAGALAPGVPERDLVLTGDHALMIDGLAVNAAALVNGRSILRITPHELPERVTYWHIETEHHDAVLAEGVAAETFVDNVTRRHFDNYAEYEARFGEEIRRIEPNPVPRVMSGRQLPESIRTRLAERADLLERDAAIAA